MKVQAVKYFFPGHRSAPGPVDEAYITDIDTAVRLLLQDQSCYVAWVDVPEVERRLAEVRGEA